MPMIDFNRVGVDTRYSPMPTRIKIPIHPSGWTRKEWQICSSYCSHSIHAIYQAERALKLFLGNEATIYFYESGSAALLAVLQALHLLPGSEVLLTSFNCPSVVKAVLAAQLVPVFFDILSDGTPCPDSLVQALSPRSRVVIVTHLFGKIAPGLEQIHTIASQRGLCVIDDAAQSLGAHNSNGYAGTFGKAGILSFGRTKPLSCGGGGAVVTSDQFLQQRLQWQDGVVKSSVEQMRFAQREMQLRSYPSFLVWLWQRLGWLSSLETDTVAALLRQTDTARLMTTRRIHPLSAQLLPSQLSHLVFRQQQAYANAQYLKEHLADIEDITLPQGVYPEHVYTNFAIRLQRKKRYALAAHMSQRGVQTSWFYYPLHLLSPYERLPHTDLTLTETIWQQILIIPCRDLHLRSLRIISKGVRSFYGSP